MAPAALTLIALPDIGHIEPGADLAAAILASLARCQETLRDGDVLVVAQKVVSKAESRYVDLRDVEPSERALELAREVDKDARLVELVLRESSDVVRKRRGLLIVAHRLGLVLANAGIDRSNIAQSDGSDRVLLLPEDPDVSAARLRAELGARTGTHVGVIVSDSLGRPFRRGTVGVAIGAAGVASLIDLRGTPDLFGRKLEDTEVALADEIAAAAGIVMGQAAEALPAVLVRGVPRPANAVHRAASALARAREEDLFR